MMIRYQLCFLVAFLLCSSSEVSSKLNQSQKVVANLGMLDSLEKVSEASSSHIDPDDADDDDDDDDDGSGLSDVYDDYYLEGASFSGQGIDDQVLKSIAHSDATLVPDSKNTSAPATSSVKPDDIHFMEEDADEDDVDSSSATKKDKKKQKISSDDSLYEYNNEDYEKDYEDLDGGNNPLSPAALPPTTTPPNHPATEDSFSFQPSYIFLIIASALISFTVFMVVFYLCRRSVLQRRGKKTMPFVVSSANMRPSAPLSSIASDKSSPIVKNYQLVPSSTKEFIYQQQQLQQQQIKLESSQQTDSEKPLLT